MAKNGNAQGICNRILAKLPRAVRQLVAAKVESVELSPNEVICGAGKRIKQVYFPSEGVISLFATGRGSAGVGVGVVGIAGMFGLGIAVGRPVSAFSAVSQGHGRADRIDANGFLALLSASAELRDAMLAYSYELSVQLAQNAACVLLHPAQKRMARWMLDVSGDARTGEVYATQAAIATFIGVQRPVASRAAAELQRRGLIRYFRGEIAILDRAGLMNVACACSSPFSNL